MDGTEPNLAQVTSPVGHVAIWGDADAVAFVDLATRMCGGYTLEELQRMSLTFKAQIDVLRARPSTEDVAGIPACEIEAGVSEERVVPALGVLRECGCGWRGCEDDCVWCGMVGPLCPECRETTEERAK